MEKTYSLYINRRSRGQVKEPCVLVAACPGARTLAPTTSLSIRLGSYICDAAFCGPRSSANSASRISLTVLTASQREKSS